MYILSFYFDLQKRRYYLLFCMCVKPGIQFQGTKKSLLGKIFGCKSKDSTGQNKLLNADLHNYYFSQYTSVISVVKSRTVRGWNSSWRGRWEMFTEFWSEKQERHERGGGGVNGYETTFLRNKKLWFWKTENSSTIWETIRETYTNVCTSNSYFIYLFFPPSFC
jgi:hypothetical protein